MNAGGFPKLYCQLSLLSQASTQLPDMIDNQLDMKEAENHASGSSERLRTQENWLPPPGGGLLSLSGSKYPVTAEAQGCWKTTYASSQQPIPAAGNSWLRRLHVKPAWESGQ